ncbi:hypothetical protein EDB84DRAFT_1678896 [Lactarius hengduanensis]|nr:hypothetical protein EDB84DRAFT_1678896 [Lactarius hengduanensis]
MTFLGILTFLHNAREIARQRCTIFPFSCVIRQILVPTYHITEGSIMKVFRSLKNTHYLFEVPRQACVTHLVRCFSRFSAAHAEIFGIYGGRNECAPKRHNLPVGGPLSTLPGLVVTASSGSLGHQSRDASSRPTSTILPSPGTTDSDRHPFYAVLAASAGVSGVSPALSAFSFRPTPRHLAFHILPARRHAPLSLMSPPPRSTSRRFSPQLLGVCGRKVGHGFAHCGEQLAQIGKLGTNAIIGRLIEPSPHPRRRVASLANVLAYLATLDTQSCLWPSVSPSRRAIAHVCGRRMCFRGYARAKRGIVRGSHQVRQMSNLVRKRSFPSVSVECAALPSVSEDDGECPREYVAFCVVYDWALGVSGGFSNSPSHCVFGAITTIGSGEEMESENGGILKSVSLADTAWRQVLKAISLYSLPLPVQKCSTIGVIGACLGKEYLQRVARGDFPSAPSECVIASSVVDVVGEQQGGVSMSGQDIFLLSPSRLSSRYRFPRHNCAFVHATRTSLDVRMSTRKPSTRHPSSESVQK